MGCGPSVLGVKCGFPMTVGSAPRRSRTIGNGAPPHYVWHRSWLVYTPGYLSNKKRALGTPPLTPPGAPWGPNIKKTNAYFFKTENRLKSLYTPYLFEMKCYDIEPRLKVYIPLFQPPGHCSDGLGLY